MPDNQDIIYSGLFLFIRGKLSVFRIIVTGTGRYNERELGLSS